MQALQNVKSLKFLDFDPAMSSAALEKWVTCRRPKPDASIRLFCTAWAGGSATAFVKWPSFLPNEVEVRALQLPGRMSRAKEECLTTVPGIVDKIAEALIALGLLDKPFALFGHSFGSLLMYELARKLVQDAGVTPTHIIVSACRPPDMCAREQGMNPVSQLPREALVDHLVDLGGIPTALRHQRELLDHFLPAIRSDYAALECYEHKPRAAAEGTRIPLLECSLVCIGGDADETAPRSDLQYWASFTTGEFRLRMFSGGHFFLRGEEDEAAVLAFLSGVLISTPR